MSPEYGSTCAIFPIDDETLNYLRFTGRPEEQVALVEAYAKEQGLWHDPSHEPRFSETLELDLSTVVPARRPEAAAGPRPLADAEGDFRAALRRLRRRHGPPRTAGSTRRSDESSRPPTRWPRARTGDRRQAGAPHNVGEVGGRPSNPRPVTLATAARFDLDHGAVVIAAITSLHQHQQPAGHDRRGAARQERGREGPHPQALGQDHAGARAKVVTDYYEQGRPHAVPGQARLQPRRLRLHHLHRQLRTAAPEISKAINDGDLAVVSVLSGNRNFEGRINPDVKMNYLASPPLVVAYALAGTMDIDLATEPLGTGTDGSASTSPTSGPPRPRSPTSSASAIQSDMFTKDYADVFAGDERWQGLDSATPARRLRAGTATPPTCAAPVLRRHGREPAARRRHRGRPRAGDARRQRHHRPHLPGRRHQEGLAGRPLPGGARRRARDFNSYGSRRGNHEVMIRGTFANIRLRNQLAPGTEGGVTRHLPDGEADGDLRRLARVRREGVPLVVLAGKEYGSGSSRDWAAKGTALLGVRAVHRRVLRAHPPLQPDRHGRAAAAVRRRRVGRVARADRRGDVHHPRAGRRRTATGDHHGAGRRQELRGAGAHRHPR